MSFLTEAGPAVSVNIAEMSFLTDRSVRKQFKGSFDRRMSVRKSIFPHMTEFVGQKCRKKYW
jgi:hypothetical protein